MSGKCNISIGKSATWPGVATVTREASFSEWSTDGSTCHRSVALKQADRWYVHVSLGLFSVSLCLFSLWPRYLFFISAFLMKEAAVMAPAILSRAALRITLSAADYFCLYKKRWCESSLVSLFFLVPVHTFEKSEWILATIISEPAKISGANRDACTHTPQVGHISSVYWLWAQELWHWHWSV